MTAMPDDWQFQIRVYLTDAGAALARRDPGNPALAPLMAILRAHRATLKCQFDAFADYVAEAEAQGADQFPLYRWTKATIEDAEKAAKHRKAFAIRVDGNEVHAKDVADALEADLRKLVGGEVVTRLSRHDTNPANNIPVPAHLRS
jgi:hypothetical protein